MSRHPIAALALALFASAAPAQDVAGGGAAGSNPIITDRFTADPAALVHDGTVYLYVGHDDAREGEMFRIEEWLAYSSRDMKTWTAHGPIMKATDFKWATKDAWASQVIERGGKFYFYTTVEHDGTHPGKAIGVAVSDSPTGPFVDARGSALVYNQMTPDGPHSWDDIDPTVYVETDGTAWLMWGNGNCYLAKLKPNMTELDGEIRKIDLPNYVEGPWLHRHEGLYYLTYAAIDRAKGKDERIAYATSRSITGPWTYRGELTGSAENSFTIHPAIIEFNKQWYFFYHNAALTISDRKGALGRRAVAVEYLYHNKDGTIRPIVQTKAGVSIPPAKR